MKPSEFIRLAVEETPEKLLSELPKGQGFAPKLSGKRTEQKLFYPLCGFFMFLLCLHFRSKENADILFLEVKTWKHFLTL